MKFCKNDILQYQPDVIICIDYPGFNLRIAEFAHQHQFKVVYYISPQVWAWKKSRVFTIRKVVDKMMVILPFEKDFYASYDYQVDFVGHPLLDVINPADNASQSTDKEKVIALLPGSRKQEIERMLPIMLAVIPSFPQHHFTIAGAPGIDPAFYKQLIGNKTVDIIFGKTYDLLFNASAALVTSGTASLETALFQVPQVICYKGSPVSYAIAKRIVSVKYIGLPNLIMDKEIIKELIQHELTHENLVTELSLILDNTEKIKRIKEDYRQLALLLGGKGASSRAAEKIMELLNENPL